MSKRRGMGCGTALVVLIGISLAGYVAVKMLAPEPTPEEARREAEREGQRRTEEREQARRDAEQRAEDDEYGSRSMAIALAKDAITDLLKSPSTAKFPSWFKIKHHRGEGEYEHLVIAWVDSQNSFGAMVRSDWLVRLEYSPPDNWKIVHVNLE